MKVHITNHVIERAKQRFGFTTFKIGQTKCLIQTLWGTRFLKKTKRTKELAICVPVGRCLYLGEMKGNTFVVKTVLFRNR